MQFAEYLLNNNGDEVKGFLRSLGYNFSEAQPEQAQKCLNHYISQGNINQLLPLHPDYGMIKDELEVMHKSQDQTLHAKIVKHPSSASVQEKTGFDWPGLNLSSLSSMGVNPNLVNVFFLLGCLYLLIRIIKD